VRTDAICVLWPPSSLAVLTTDDLESARRQDIRTGTVVILHLSSIVRKRLTVPLGCQVKRAISGGHCGPPHPEPLISRQSPALDRPILKVPADHALPGQNAGAPGSCRHSRPTVRKNKLEVPVSIHRIAGAQPPPCRDCQSGPASADSITVILIPTTIESGPTSASTRVSPKAGLLHPPAANPHPYSRNPSCVFD